MKNKIIIVDADGTILFWQDSFDKWMAKKGYAPAIVDVAERHAEYRIWKQYGVSPKEAMDIVREFNNSPDIAEIAALRDAEHYIKLLHNKHNYVFHCITSLSAEEHAHRYRSENLKQLFGPTAFEKLICLETGGDKTNTLAQYKDTECWWVEDVTENARIGAQLGLRPILVAHGYNETDEFPRVHSWKEIYEIITG